MPDPEDKWDNYFPFTQRLRDEILKEHDYQAYMKAWMERNPLHYPVRVRGGSLSPQRPGQIFRYNEWEGCFGFIYLSDTPDDLIDAWKSYLVKLLAVLDRNDLAVPTGPSRSHSCGASPALDPALL